MKRIIVSAGLLLAAACGGNTDRKAVLRQMEAEGLAECVASKYAALFTGSLRAGDGYDEVWIRDYNTFIELAMDYMPDSVIRGALNTFFAFQGEEGDIVDGYMEREKAEENTYDYRLAPSRPQFVAHKNTVETDQEASLVQAVCKYVRKSGNPAYLDEQVDGVAVKERLERALAYLRDRKTDARYGLLTGATTADWGDVQPEHGWGVAIDQNTHYSIDIYDNAMYLLAIDDYLELVPDGAHAGAWKALRERTAGNIRRHLWDAGRKKFIPHIYLDGSPFPADFDENAIFYHGGTAVAALAGLLSREELAEAYRRMEENRLAAQAQTIGLTMYPPYPEGFFLNPGMHPYGYQNGGDWSWFGARMVEALARYGFYREAYEALRPMLQRIVDNDGFFEWYRPDGTPQGSGTFRGEAGVIYRAIRSLQDECPMGQP